MGQLFEPRSHVNITRMSWLAQVLCLGLLLFRCSAAAAEDQLSDVAEPRLFFANYTSGLLAINTTILVVALGIAAAVGVAAVLLLGYVEDQPVYSEQYQYQSRGFRASGSSSFDILTLLSVASDIYRRLDYEDVDCQKKIICEFMREPEMFGNGAKSVRSGVAMATTFLQSWGVPYVTEIQEAADLAEKSGGSCEERYNQCQEISLKESYVKSAEKVKDVFTKDYTPSNQNKQEEEEEEEYEYEYYDRK